MGPPNPSPSWSRMMPTSPEVMLILSTPNTTRPSKSLYVLGLMSETVTAFAHPPAYPPHLRMLLRGGAHFLTRMAWVGQVHSALYHLVLERSQLPSAKSTISRLNATPLERDACEKRMATAVRTILECIGEDPDREGLRKTPERYAQAIMWMTRGYEERLAGGLTSYSVNSTLHTFQTSSTMPYSRRITMRWFWSVTSTSRVCVNII
jgi:hypothetical protein